MSTLPNLVLRQLNCAQGWLSLGDWEEAMAELESIEAAYQNNPLLLALRVQAYQRAQNWSQMAELSRHLTVTEPGKADHWLTYAYGLRRCEGLHPAKEVLEKAASMFYVEATIWFNLACYCAQLGLLPEAKAHLNTAMELEPGCRKLALEDPDLEPLWSTLKK